MLFSMADDLEQEERKKGREEAEQSKALDTLTDHVSQDAISATTNLFPKLCKALT